MTVHFYIRRKLDIMQYDTKFFSVAENWLLSTGYYSVLKPFWLVFKSEFTTSKGKRKECMNK